MTTDAGRGDDRPRDDAEGLEDFRRQILGRAAEARADDAGPAAPQVGEDTTPTIRRARPAGTAARRRRWPLVVALGLPLVVVPFLLGGLLAGGPAPAAIEPPVPLTFDEFLRREEQEEQDAHRRRMREARLKSKRAVRREDKNVFDRAARAIRDFFSDNN